MVPGKWLEKLTLDVAKWIAAGLSLLATVALPVTVTAQDDLQADAAVDQVPLDAEVIAAEIKNFKFPPFDQSRNGEQEYVQEWRQLHLAAMAQWMDLVAKLFQSDPGHADLPRHMERRWNEFLFKGQADKIRDEAQRAIEHDEASNLAKIARFFQTQVSISAHRNDPGQALAAVNDFIRQVPGDERGARLLIHVAGLQPAGSDEQMATYRRIVDDFQGTRTATWAAGQMRQISSINQPFELSFTCAISKRKIDMNSLHGKVVLIDFWATWCGPCVVEMPKLKELYQKYQDEGFEIVGVSLDSSEADGGGDALRKFVDENQIPWPQYYQGNGWEGEFSTGWGINAIPSLFIVDRGGRLRSTNARGKLDDLIPALLAEDATTPLDAAIHANPAENKLILPQKISDSR